MLRIGEFAARNNITVRALRHYEDIGLLLPALTDRMTGYRYYDEQQDRDIKLIGLLKELGFSLSEISELLRTSVEKKTLVIRLNEKYTQARIDLDKAQSRSLGVERLLQSVEGLPDGRKVNIKEMTDMDMNDMVERFSPEMAFMENYERILRKALDDGRNITTMVLDIDRFKRINDKYGHKIGDAVLDGVAREIIGNLKPGSEKSGLLWGKTSVLERKGGDEYIIRVEADPVEGMDMAEAICRGVAGLDLGYLGIDEGVTVSIGVANLDSRPQNAAEFTHLAESAMYLAKHNGRNRVQLYCDDIGEKLNCMPESDTGGAIGKF